MVRHSHPFRGARLMRPLGATLLIVLLYAVWHTSHRHLMATHNLETRVGRRGRTRYASYLRQHDRSHGDGSTDGRGRKHSPFGRQHDAGSDEEAGSSSEKGRIAFEQEEEAGDVEQGIRRSSATAAAVEETGGDNAAGLGEEAHAGGLDAAGDDEAEAAFEATGQDEDAAEGSDDAADDVGAASSSGGGGGGSGGGGTGLRKAPPREITADKPLLFYDVGGAYHHMPTCPEGWATPGFGCDAEPCPVPWSYADHPADADAIIYNTLNGMYNWGTSNIRERPDQWVVMWAMESGKYYPAIYDAKQNGADLNADYRLESDVPVPYYTEWELPNINATPVAFKDKRKDALVAAFISNCGALNNRGDVLEDLIRLLGGKLHSYGGCGHNRDESQEHVAHQGGNSRERKMDILPTYKFAFTPENSNDIGYVTEKLYQALEAGAIPIYMGAPDVDRFIPVPEAIIKVWDFKSTEELAAYIEKVAEDESLWEKHMAWKKLPQDQWSKDWQAFRRMTQYSSHCRTAMHIGGKPHQWRDPR